MTSAPVTPVLESARLRLRSVRDDDAAVIQRLIDDADVVRFLAVVPFPYTMEDAQAFVASAQGHGPFDVGEALAIENRADSEFLGVMSLRPDPHVLGAAILGYWITKSRWGQGLTTEAAKLAVDYGFAARGYASISAKAAVANPTSRKVLAKAGLMPVGSDGLHWLPARNRSEPAIMHVLARDAWAAARTKRIVHVAAVALVDADDRVLIAQRPPGKAMAGLWEFPGGKVEAGETPEACLIRELREELGIDTEASCLAPFTFASHAYENFHLLMPLFVCRVWRGQVRGREGQALKWVEPLRLADYPMPAADIPLVAMLRDFL